MLRIATYNTHEADSLQQLVNRYGAEKVDVVKFPAAVYEGAILRTAGPAGSNQLDIYDIPFALADSVATQFESLPDLGAPCELDGSEDAFHAGLIDRLRTAGGVVASPWRCSSYILIYRADLARRLELEAPGSIPKAIDLARAARQQLGLYGYAAAQRSGLHMAIDWLPFLWEYGGDVLRDGQVVLDSPEALSALRAYVELNAYSPWQSIELEHDEPTQMLLQGSVAMVQQWCSGAARVCEQFPESEKFGYLPGLGAPVFGGGGLGIPIGSKSRDAALELLRWLKDPAVDIERVRLGGTPIYGATLEGLSQAAAQPLWAARLAASAKARDKPRRPDWPAIQRALSQTVRAALVGRSDLRALLAEAAHEITGIVLDSAAKAGR